MVKKAAKKSAGKKSKPSAKPILKPAKKAVIGDARKQVANVTVSAVTMQSLVHRLDALLHTMRTIAQHEDVLCTLLHDSRRSGKPGKALLRELTAVLHELPAEEYAYDLRAVLEMTASI